MPEPRPSSRTRTSVSRTPTISCERWDGWTPGYGYCSFGRAWCCADGGASELSSLEGVLCRTAAAAADDRVVQESDLVGAADVVDPAAPRPKPRVRMGIDTCFARPGGMTVPLKSRRWKSSTSPRGFLTTTRMRTSAIVSAVLFWSEAVREARVLPSVKIPNSSMMLLK